MTSQATNVAAVKPRRMTEMFIDFPRASWRDRATPARSQDHALDEHRRDRGHGVGVRRDARSGDQTIQAPQNLASAAPPRLRRRGRRHGREADFA
jgi:hypothetical protein